MIDAAMAEERRERGRDLGAKGPGPRPGPRSASSTRGAAAAAPGPLEEGRPEPSEGEGKLLLEDGRGGQAAPAGRQLALGRLGLGLGLALLGGALVAALRRAAPGPRCGPREAAAPGPPRCVLLVGDSLTFVNDLDLQVQSLAAAAAGASGDGRAPVVVERVVQGYAPLRVLWQETEAKTRIASGGYDVVVLQEDLPETDIATFRRYAELFHEECRKVNASMVLLAAWPYERLGWISAEGIAEAHREVAAQLSVRLAPVGTAWRQAQAERAIQLYAEDHEHPSLSGTYLAAAVVFSTVWQRTPVGLDYSADGKLDARDVEFLQRVAWDVAQQNASGASGLEDPNATVK